MIGSLYRGENVTVWVIWAGEDAMLIEVWKGGITLTLDYGLNREGELWVRGHGVSSEDMRAALTAQALARDW